MSRYTVTVLTALVLAACLGETASAQRGRGGARGGFGGRGGFGAPGMGRGFRPSGLRGYYNNGFRLYFPAYRGFGYGGYGAGGYGYGAGGYGGYGAPYLSGYGGLYNSGYGYSPVDHGGYYYPDDQGDVPPVPDDDIPPVPDEATPKAPTDNTARIHVNLPPEAQLWFEGHLTGQTGAKRDFYSPKLAPGKTFLYRIRARWREGDRVVEQSGEFKVRANETTTVRFPLPRKDELPPPREAPPR